MATKRKTNTSNNGHSRFHLTFKNVFQRIAWGTFQQHDVLFLIGPAGCGKSFLATAFAISEVLQKTKKKIVLTRPIVEAGENLGYLPGDLHEKVNPYMIPLLDSMKKLVGTSGPQHDMIAASVTISPIAYMRGITFDDSICIFDEAQNATLGQLKLFLSRFGENSKIIVTGDPYQSDLGDRSGLMDVIHRIESISGVGVVKFDKEAIVRHPLVSQILDKLED